MGNLISELQSEINRCRELVSIYEKIPTGAFGAAAIKMDIRDAENAISEIDTVRMIRCLARLKNCQ